MQDLPNNLEDRSCDRFDLGGADHNDSLTELHGSIDETLIEIDGDDDTWTLKAMVDAHSHLSGGWAHEAHSVLKVQMLISQA